MNLRLGLRWRVMAMVVLVAFASGVSAWFITVNRIRSNISDDLKRRARVFGRALEASLEIQMVMKQAELSIPFGSDESAQKILGQLLEAVRVQDGYKGTFGLDEPLPAHLGEDPRQGLGNGAQKRGEMPLGDL